jgi:hypothetical protein
MQWLKDTGDLPYMMPVSPWFYTNLPGYGKNWIWNGDNLWYDRWQQVISLKPEFVEIISWNDYGESHYIGPLHEGAYATFEIGNASYNYAAGHPHDGWRDFLPFMIDVYKGARANVTTEGVTAWFRQSPGKACTSGGTMGNTKTHGQKEFPPTDVLQDEVFYTALLRTAQDVKVTVDIGGVVQDGKWKNKPHGPVGLYHGSVPFDGNTGQVIVTVSRRGETVAEMRGASISESCLDDIQNWNAWVGTNFANNTISRHPPSPAPTSTSTSVSVSTASTLLLLGRIPFIVFVVLVASMVAATTPVQHEKLVLTVPISEVSPSVYNVGASDGNARSLYSHGTSYGLYPIDYPYATTMEAPVFISTCATAFAYDSWNLDWS